MRAIVGCVLGAFVASAAWAKPLLTGDGKPSLVTAWSAEGKKVTLTLEGGADANEVASAIQSKVEGVKQAKVAGGKVIVVGLAEADLVKAMSGVELGGDDIGALAAASLGDDDEGSGSSLRAKRTAKLNEMFKDRATVAKGTVVSVEGQTFPKTKVKVKVIAGPSGEASKNVRKGQVITFVPQIAMKGTAPDYADENTLVNVGAWYFMPNDKVQVKVGKETSGAYEAVVISR
jgi:hypothetical protein